MNHADDGPPQDALVGGGDEDDADVDEEDEAENTGDDDEGRAPICPQCGVTALPLDAAHVIDTRFGCENPDCDQFGEQV